MKSNEERVNSILKKAREYKMKKRKEGYAVISSICALAMIAIVATSTLNISKSIVNIHEIQKVDTQKENFENIEEIKLTTFESKSELIKKLKSSEAYTNRKYRIMIDTVDMAINSSVSSDTAGAAKESVASESNYSETNTQVQGVDESDIVKTNGDYIYYLSDNTLRIFNNQNDKLSLEKEIKFYDKENGEYTYPSELYISDNYIVVIATSRIITEPEDIMSNVARKVATTSYRKSKTSTKVMIYDIKNYELIREIETEGNYMSSRKVDNDIYLISNKYIYLYNDIVEDDVLPLCKDTCVENGKLREVDIETVKCFPSFEEEECSYMIITSFSLNNIEEKANVETYIGTGSEIYCSKENLYVAKIDYNYDDYSTKTLIRKFAIYGGDIKYVAEGKVPGSLLNQFSMDEYNKNFRITTTSGNTFDETSENNLYVLDENLNTIGELTGLAKGEEIYSTRFMGDKCYVVTYKTVDPLFVIDLSDPNNPCVLGELKIPGYSSYLHPLGENYLIGFGEDSVEKTYKRYDGTESVTAYSTGLKLAIFDVSDYNNPKEIDSVKIGGRGSSSELLYNHKSLLFKEDEGLFAFPVRLYEEDAGTYENGVPKYGKFEFSGAVIFNVDVENGISLRGKVSNNSEKYNDIERILYIDNKLYTLSDDMIKVLDIKSLKEISNIEF